MIFSSSTGIRGSLQAVRRKPNSSQTFRDYILGLDEGSLVLGLELAYTLGELGLK